MEKKTFLVNGAASLALNPSDKTIQELTKDHLSKIKGGENLPIIKKPTIIIEDEVEI